MTHIVTEKSPLLEYLLKHFTAIKKIKIKQFLKHGAITVNGIVTTKHNHPLRPGDKIDFLTKASSLKERLKTYLSFPIVYEDEWLIVIDKPAGLLTMGTDKDKFHTAYYEITDYVRAQTKDGQGRIFIVHRLDRESSGLVVFAKSMAVKTKLQAEWSEAVKKYFAVVEGVPRKPEGKIESYLVEDSFKRVYSTSERSREAKHAVTLYRLLRHNAGLALLDITLITGRKNQIRVHLADLGHPIIGDVKYDSLQNPARRLGLHAHTLSFRHPQTGEIKTFESPLPDSLAKIL